MDTHLKQFFAKYINEPYFVDFITIFIIIFIITFSSVLVNYISKIIINFLVGKIIKKSKNKWDDIFFENKFFEKISHFFSALTLYNFSYIFKNYSDLIHKFSYIYIIISGNIVFFIFLDSLETIYREFKISKEKPIKGYIQIIKIVVFILSLVFVVSALIDKSPWKLLSGIGAMTAVILFIFKDAILGFIAGIQLSVNKMVQIGDWIEMPKYNADGDVIEINLTTIKVQNWDKTITSIPIYSLVSDSFKNWRGMQESGGRRIKRAIFIDVASIKFCDENMLQKFKKIELIKKYITEKEEDIKKYNKEKNVNCFETVNGRNLTNIGTFRIYIEKYLKNHPLINQAMTLIVRQLQSGEKGIPLEIYAFTSDIRWINYEGIQSDIFDHIFAVISEFELRIFQLPSGNDIKNLK